MPDGRLAHRIWYGAGFGPSLARAVLTPLSWAFAAAAHARNALYDARVLPSVQAPIPVVSVGNLTVGGTGKTPLAAFLASRLRELGARPALVMRGVGDDESRAYSVIAPGIPVIQDPNRARGVSAAARAGADVAVLDDAFQHRRIRRNADVVIVSADRAAGHLLPAGPARESMMALRRADLCIVTRKAAPEAAAEALAVETQRRFPRLPVAQVSLVPDELVQWGTEDRQPIGALAGKRVLAVAGIGDPVAFFRQLAQVRELEPLVYSDHHAYTDRDAAAIAESAKAFDLVVCTLKDAVKLGPLWPRGSTELWYVSQRLQVEKGAVEIERMLARLLELRPANRT